MENVKPKANGAGAGRDSVGQDPRSARSRALCYRRQLGRNDFPFLHEFLHENPRD
jgi:hypothetical protein